MKLLLFRERKESDDKPDHSSAGRAEDCRVARLSLGRWFDSGWSEFFYIHLKLLSTIKLIYTYLHEHEY